jgi:hypothetical protein
MTKTITTTTITMAIAATGGKVFGATCLIRVNRMHLHKLVKKAAEVTVAGCGCAIVLALGVSTIALGSPTGVKDWLYGSAEGVLSSLPKRIQIPEEIRLPAEIGLPESINLPQLPGLHTLSSQEQILLGNETAQKQGLEGEEFVEAQIDAVEARLIPALPADCQGPLSLHLTLVDRGFDGATE